MKTSLEHLPEHKREQVAAVATLLQVEAQAEMVILFGSHARGDWVEDPETGYYSDFDILIVAPPEVARRQGLSADLSQRARAFTGRTPVRVLVHDIKEVNHEIRLGQYFFADILREGVLLHDSRRYSLASPKALTPADRLKLGLINFRYWFGSAGDFWRTAGHAAGRGLGPQAAFLLHQSVERYFAAALLVFTGYKPKSHDIQDLANQAASLHTALAGALPRTEAEDKRLFDLLRRGYIDARYSKSYSITAEELRILREHVHDLGVRVRQACVEKLESFCGPEQVGELPEVPPSEGAADFAEALSDPVKHQELLDRLPPIPPTSDPALLDAREDVARYILRDRRLWDRLVKPEVDAAAQETARESARRSLMRVLARRGFSLTPEQQARIDAETAVETLERWLDQAITATRVEDALA